MDVCFGDPSLTLRMTKEVLRMTGELGRTRRSVMLNEVKHLSAEDPSLTLRMTKEVLRMTGKADRRTG